MITLYGIKSCDTVRKARKWLDSSGLAYQYHDFRVDGLESTELTRWTKSVGWKTLLNTRSTSWRQLSEPKKNDLGESVAIELMIENTTLIKRPVLISGNKILVGFKEPDYEQLL